MLRLSHPARTGRRPLPRLWRRDCRGGTSARLPALWMDPGSGLIDPARTSVLPSRTQVRTSAGVNRAWGLSAIASLLFLPSLRLLEETTMVSHSDELVELTSSRRAPLPGARSLGPALPQEEVVVTLLLRRGSSPSDFQSAFSAATTIFGERRILSRAEYASRHGARESDLEAVRAFAARHRLEVIEEAPSRRTVRLGGSVERLELAFGVKLARYGYANGTYRGRVGTIRLSSDLKGIVLGVFGLDNRPQARTHFRRRNAPQAGDLSYTPLQVAQAYNFPAGANGTGQCIGLVELGGGFRPEDLSSYFQSLDVTSPQVTAVSVDGGVNAPTGDPDGPDGEVELDIEISGLIAPGAQIAVYFAPNTDQGFFNGVMSAIHDSALRPSVVSISWGSAEGTWTQQARDALNAACEEAATMGITILVAAGDQGADDGDVSGTPTVDFPAASPYAIGCGGTRLTISAGARGPSEVVWNELSKGEGATGGGVSELFALPSYQSGNNVPAAPNGFVGRGVPDVAGDADPASGYQVLVDGSTTVIGGTSAVAPLWAGLVARINQAIGAPLGFANPLFYEPQIRAAFRDIVSGNNGGYSARPGWDACTGLGAPDGTALLAALRVEGGAGTRPATK